MIAIVINKYGLVGVKAITTKIFLSIQQEIPDCSEWGRWKEENWSPHWTCQEDASMACSIIA